MYKVQAPAEPRKLERFLATKERKEHKNAVLFFLTANERK
jgi:hypothetical protein